MKRILIANRGLAALKFIYSLNELPEKAYTFIGIVTENDMCAKYKYIDLLDEIINAENNIYTDIQTIVNFAIDRKIDAVWPGWGYLSENPAFATALRDAGIEFIGPSADCLTILGDKLECMKLASRLNIPVLAYQEIESETELKAVCEKIKYPVMLKAVEGGGGKGIREVQTPDELLTNYNSVTKEVSGKLFVMKKAVNSFHLEVQFVSDGHKAKHLYGRDCSIQRRSQKLIEEGPMTIAPKKIQEEMYQAAVLLAETMCYKGVGTAEFLYNPQDNTYTFLEINPRLQVEHIITELLLTLNLPAIQMAIYEGRLLSEIPSLTVIEPPQNIHIMSTRINAENPYNGFQPSCGKIESIEFTTVPNSWAYFCIGKHSTIVSDADSQIGHMFAIGKNRTEAMDKLYRMLNYLHISGTIFNTGKFIKNILKHPVFRAQKHYTTWLNELNITRDCAEDILQEESIVLCGAILKAKMDGKPVVDLNYKQKNYGFNIYYKDKTVIIGIKKEWYRLNYYETDGDLYICINERVYHTVLNSENYQGMEITINLKKYWFPFSINPYEFKSTICGRINKFLFPEGTVLQKDVPYVEIEVMKMLLPLCTTAEGKIFYKAKINEMVTVGTVLAYVNHSPGGLPGLTCSEGGEADFTTFLAHSKVGLDEATRFLPASVLPTKYVPDIMKIIEYFNPVEIIPLKNLKSKSDSISMCAWELILEQDQHVILLANDPKIQNGSFGPEEDAFFEKITYDALEKGYPRIYISSNTGARLTINEKLKQCYRIKWLDPTDIHQGVEYLYLTETDYQKYKTDVQAEYIEQDVWKIKSIHNAGVETLDGAAAIARSTVHAYRKGLTFTYVTGMSVGIGAYLAKLGERVIQKRDAPIILTGFNTLNKIIGKEVYHSNLQIGGPDVMGCNGISHRVVDTDQEGVETLLRWLNYRPCKPPSPEMILKLQSTTFVPNAETPTHALIDAFFDQGSFFELMPDWAKTVKTGRAYLNGLPVGVIAANNQTVKKCPPLDPGNPCPSEELQSGCVWYPDSALKTAQAINDLKNEKLPLIIFANWRGFSGGTSDMYHDILRQGSAIVKALVDYTQPVYIYIPPYCQLRGGAMVVLSKSINNSIRMYADPTARVNILEPSGVLPIKYKPKDIESTMGRHGVEITDKNTDLFQRVALDFIDKHDVPTKNSVIADLVPWATSQTYFYNLLKNEIS